MLPPSIAIYTRNFFLKIGSNQRGKKEGRFPWGRHCKATLCSKAKVTCWTFGIFFLLRLLGLKATDWALGRRVWTWAGKAESQKEKELQ